MDRFLNQMLLEPTFNIDETFKIFLDKLNEEIVFTIKFSCFIFIFYKFLILIYFIEKKKKNKSFYKKNVIIFIVKNFN